MLNLTSTSDIIRITASSANPISCAVEYVDHTSAAYTPGRQLTALASSSVTTICNAPAASTTRSIKFMGLCAKGGANTIVLEQFDGTTAAQLIGSTTFALAAGDTLQFVDCDGWRVVPAQGPGAGRLLGIQYINPGTTSIAHTTGATTAVIEGVGGGGAGGGCSTGTGSMGGNGSSGTWGRKRVTLVGLASTCVVGAAGTGVASSAGNPGANTTFTHNGVTMTLPGGPAGTAAAGGITVAVAPGGAAATAATNADVSITGQPGAAAVRVAAATTPIIHTGAGGSNPLGAGAAGLATSSTTATGQAGTGFGSGGSGSLGGTSAVATAGGAGAPGLLIVYDYA